MWGFWKEKRNQNFDTKPTFDEVIELFNLNPYLLGFSKEFDGIEKGNLFKKMEENGFIIISIEILSHLFRFGINVFLFFLNYYHS